MESMIIEWRFEVPVTEDEVDGAPKALLLEMALKGPGVSASKRLRRELWLGLGLGLGFQAGLGLGLS